MAGGRDPRDRRGNAHLVAEELMRTFPVYVLALTAGAASLNAQTLSAAVKQLYSFGGTACGEQICLSVDAGAHLEHFNPAAAGAQAGLTTFLQQAIGASAANIPIAATTSTGILVQSGEGLPTRVSTSGGPIFAERMQTIGKHNWYFSFNATNFDYSTLRGVPLTGLHSTITHQDTPPAGLGQPNFENDVIEVSTSMHVQMTAFTGVVTFGLFDHVDVGVAVPFLYSSLSGSSTALIMPSGVNDPHFFGDSANPSLSATSNASASASGIGDVVARVKVGILAKKEWGVAFLGDVRMPTGNEQNFQGSGSWGFEGIGIVSAQFGQFSPHLNLGYSAHSSSTLNDAVLATLGFDQQMANWCTLAVDVLSSWQVGASNYDLPQPVVLTFYGNSTIPPTHRTIIPSNIPDQRDNTVIGSFGLKFLTRSGVTIVTNALVPMLRGGLQPGAAFTLGVDYTLY
jgi:hypothetical protein